MNKIYIDNLIKLKRVGTLIKQITLNEHNWSVDNFQYIFDECITHKLYYVFYFLLEIFNKRSCIDFINNERYYQPYTSRNEFAINNVFLWACYNGHKEIVEYLLFPKIQQRYPNIDPSSIDNNGFRWACYNGYFKIVSYLLSSEIQERFPNIDPYSTDNNGFRWACYNGYFKIVSYLLSSEIQERFPNIDPSALENYGFIYACEKGHKEIVEYLLSPKIQERYPQVGSNLNSIQIEQIKNY